MRRQITIALSPPGDEAMLEGVPGYTAPLVQGRALLDPGAQEAALLVGHAGLIAQGHGVAQDRLGIDPLRVLADLGWLFQCHVGRRRFGVSQQPEV